jgi:hypothetical protein
LVEGTEPNALVHIWREDPGYPGPRDEPFLKAFAGWSSANVIELPDGLQQGWELSATQEICEENRSERSPSVSVEPIDYLEEFKLLPPVYLDMASRLVEVVGLHESTLSLVGITPDGDEEEIGRTTSAGRTRFRVNVDPDTAIEEVYPEVYVVQSFQCRSEAAGRAVRSEVPSERVPTEGLLRAEPLDLEEQSEVVRAHNACRERFRGEVGLSRERCPNLVWSDELASWAQSYANQLAADDPLTLPPYDEIPHSDRNTQRGNREDGENLAATTSSTVAYYVASVLETKWCQEERERYFEDDQPQYERGRGWGHYTQIVWYETYAVGCGRAQGESGWRYWVCHYRVDGNEIGQWPHGQDPNTLRP